MNDANTPNTVGKGPELEAVEFLGTRLTVANEGGQCLVAVKPISDSIGLSWAGQLERIKRDDVLATCIRVIRTQLVGDKQSREVVFLPLNMLNGWLFGVDAKRCKPFIRQALVRYKFECYDALAAYWQGRKVEATPTAALPAPDDLERVDHAFRGKRIEFLAGGNQVWVKASCITLALGLGCSDRITRGLPADRKLVKMRGLQRHIYIDPQAAMGAGGYVREIEKAKAWEGWLAEVLPVVVRGVSVAPAAESEPGLTGHLLEPEGEFTAIERYALKDLHDVRLMAYYDSTGRMRVRAMDQASVVCTVEQIPDLIRDSSAMPAKLLAPLLDAVAERLKRAA